jgi:hypothetical protein
MTAPKEVRDNYEEVMPGFFADVPNEIYHQPTAESKTTICWVLESVDHHNMLREMGQKTTPQMILGSAFHDCQLLYDYFKEQYLIGPTKTKTAKAWKDFVKENPSKTILTQAEYDNVNRMCNSLHKNTGMRPYFSAKHHLREVSAWLRHKETNILLKIRPDLIAKNAIVDLKSTSGGMNWKSLRAASLKYHYNVQAALYIDVSRALGLRLQEEDKDSFLLFFVQSKPPFLTAMHNFNNDDINDGRCAYNWALNQLAEYKTSDDPWGGLPRGREVVEL